MPKPLILAVGNGLAVNVPDSVMLSVGREISGAVRSASEQQECVRKALVSLADLAKGKRRACIVAGDLSLPASYEAILPQVIKALVAAEIRPSRIGFLIAPGNGYPVLGRGAIHRYGEEIVGEHELRAWAAEPGKLDPQFEAADLRIIVAPDLPGRSALPLEASHFDLVIDNGEAAKLSVASAEDRRGANKATTRFVPLSKESDVTVVSGGGGDWEATLEEAVLSLHATLATKASNESKRTLVLALSGEDGIGSAHFTRDFFALLEQANEVLAAGTELTPMESGSSFDAAGALAEALTRSASVVLYSAGLSEHDEGAELQERLSEWPALAPRLSLCGSETDLWAALQAAHKSSYSLHVEPLGWRGVVV